MNLSGSSRSSQFSRIGAVIGSAGAPKVRVIDEIEELGSKLEPGALVDRKVLKDREIDSDVPRTADRISTDVSELAGHRVCKRSRVKPLLPAAPACGFVGNAHNRVGTRIPAGVGKIRHGVDREWRTGSKRVDAHKLPAIGQKLRGSLQVFSKRHLVSVADHKPVRLIVVGARLLPAIVVLASNTGTVVESQ